MREIEAALITFGELAWGPWLLVLILGGGLYFLAASRLLPFRYLGHGIALLRGKYDEEELESHPEIIKINKGKLRSLIQCFIIIYSKIDTMA